MTDKKIESFKVGDTHRDGMSKPAAGTAEMRTDKEKAESFSLGFARIEAMLEKDDPVQVGESLNQILKDLEALGEKAESNKDKLAVKRATAAVEKAADLMDYLYQTKTAMEESLS